MNAKLETLDDVQALVDELKQSPQFASYVKDAKLELIDSRFKLIDTMIREGMVRV